MKTILIAFISLIFASQIFAGPTISGGTTTDPTISAMSLKKPAAGSNKNLKSVLVLYYGEIKIYDEAPKLEKAKKGLDYDASFPAPAWSNYQKVLVFKSTGQRFPVRLSVENTTLYLQTGKESVKTSDIAMIRKEISGIDFPTDAPYFPKFVVILRNGSKVFLED